MYGARTPAPAIYGRGRASPHRRYISRKRAWSMVPQFVAAALSDELATLARRVRESMVQVQAGPRGMGSGVIWSVGEPNATGEAEANIITNAHVVAAARAQT